ncbi:MAG TPA: hypothetical protein H9988_05235 [Candidatus Acutalibacter stercoravium]|nr:hypothetical protein [Candidatus Acutalibacter stercoravium]
MGGAPFATWYILCNFIHFEKRQTLCRGLAAFSQPFFWLGRKNPQKGKAAKGKAGRRGKSEIVFVIFHRSVVE